MSIHKSERISGNIPHIFQKFNIKYYGKRAQLCVKKKKKKRTKHIRTLSPGGQVSFHIGKAQFFI